jgi:DNA-binding beta-propeller fold protein YncE
MPAQRPLTRSVFLTPLLVVLVVFALNGDPRLISFERFPGMDNVGVADGDWCQWDEYVAQMNTPVQYTAEQQRGRQRQDDEDDAAGPETAPAACSVGGCEAVATRRPLRFIQDPHPEFSSVAIDPLRNEVILNDENRFRIFVYDRLTNTPPDKSAVAKRWIGGLNTKTQYSSGVYVDPGSGDIHVVNNDTVHELTIYGRDKQGDAPPDRIVSFVPYGSFNMVVDEDKQEMFFAVQHQGAVVVFPKNAKEKDYPARLLMGPRTRMADPHGIAFDSKNKLIFVANWGTSRQGMRSTEHPTEYIRGPIPGTGKFDIPSITVYPADADGDMAPIREIKGAKTQLNWPSSLAFDADLQEVYVANDTGDSITVFSAAAEGDVAPIRVLKGARTGLKNPTGVVLDKKNGEMWVANFGNHTATAYKLGASGDTAPIRVIRSAPAGTPNPLISNPYSIAYDASRQQIIVPNCVAHPRIGIFAREADKIVEPVRTILGQNTHLNRTVHGVYYDSTHDEILVNSAIGQAVVTFRGDASGDAAPVRIIQGSKTQLKAPDMVWVDEVNNEILVPEVDKVLVWDRLSQGDVAPKRILRGPDRLNAARVATDPIRDLLVVGGNGRIMIFKRTAQGTDKPLRVITGPHAPVGGARHGFTVYPPSGKIIVNVPARGEGTVSEVAFTGVWNIEDDGDVPPEFTIGGPHGILRNPRGVAIDEAHKTIIISDKYLNGVLTYSFPELFDRRRAPQTARGASN